MGRRVLAVFVGLVGSGLAIGLHVNRQGRTPLLPELPSPELGGAVSVVQAQIARAYDGVREKPRDLEANARVATVLHAYGYLELAVVAYQRTSLLAPRDFRWVYLLGMAQAQAGARVEATATLARAITLDTKHYAPARVHLAQLLVESGDLKGGSRLLEDVLARDPGALLARYEYGRLLARRGDLQGAIRNLGEAVAAAPRYGPAHYALAMAFRESGDPERARQHLDRYRESAQESVPLTDQLLFEVESLNDGPAKRLEIARRLAVSGDGEAAKRAYERVLEVDPSNLGARSWLIRLNGATGSLDEAREHYDRAMDSNPGWSEGRVHFGSVLVRLGSFREGVDVLREAVRGNPYSAEAHVLLGAAYEGLANFENALAAYRDALRVEPSNLDANARAGLLLLQRGDPRAARPHLQLAEREAQAQGRSALVRQMRAALEGPGAAAR